MGHFARFTTIALCVSCLAPLAGSPSAAQSALQSRTLLTQSIDETRLVQLQGNTRVEARAANDQGVVEDSLVLKGMQLLLKRSLSQEAAAEQLADEVNKPGAAHFHDWLTADAYAQRFGANLDDIATISNWLSGHGFQVHDASPSRMTINFSGTARQVHEAFHTEIHKLKVGGELHLANMSDPWIPEALAPVVEGIVSLPRFPASWRSGRQTSAAELHECPGWRGTSGPGPTSRRSTTSTLSLERALRAKARRSP